MPKPFLILTLRRTGSTALTEFLIRVSGNAGVQHEPFNRERIWGGITKAFLDDGDRRKLTARINHVVTRGRSLKHCVEVVPPVLTSALLSSCLARDYRVLVLQRRSEKERLMSLYLALATDAWGSRQAAEIYPHIRSGKAPAKRVDPEKIMRRARSDAGALGQCLIELRTAGADFGWLVFEELFAGGEAGAAALTAAARHIGVEVAPDNPELLKHLGHSGQGTRDIEAFVPGAKEMRAWLEKRYDPIVDP